LITDWYVWEYGCSAVRSASGGMAKSYQQNTNSRNAVLVLFFIENRLQTEEIAQFLPVKS